MRNYYVPMTCALYQTNLFQSKVEFSPLSIRAGYPMDHIGQAIRDTKNVNACNRMDRREFESSY